MQRQFPSNIVLDLAYVGSHGVHLMVLGDQNQAAVQTLSSTCVLGSSGTGGAPSTSSGCLSLQSRRPISTFTAIEVAAGVGSSNYNALQTKIEKRFGHGLYLLNSFTWSRGFDYASGHLEANNGDNSRVNMANLHGNYGPSGYDQPFNETLSIVYDLPYGKGQYWGNGTLKLKQSLLGGWQMTIINQAASGLPVNLNYSVNSAFTLTGLQTYRPNVTGNPVAAASKHVKTSTALTGFFDSTKVSFPMTANPVGNAQRNMVRSLPFNQLDLGIHKAFGLWREGSSLDFRAEAFNLLNHSNYSSPDSSLSNSTFGSITSAWPARQLQLAGKIIF